VGLQKINYKQRFLKYSRMVVRDFVEDLCLLERMLDVAYRSNKWMKSINSQLSSDNPEFEAKRKEAGELANRGMCVFFIQTFIKKGNFFNNLIRPVI
jgi:hypothetical protein